MSLETIRDLLVLVYIALIPVGIVVVSGAWFDTCERLGDALRHYFDGDDEDDERDEVDG